MNFVYLLIDIEELSNLGINAGTLATSVLQGLLSKGKEGEASSNPTILRIIASVTSSSSAGRLRQKLEPIVSASEIGLSSNRPQLVVLLKDENARVVREANVILLRCESHVVQELLRDPDMRSAFLKHTNKKTLVCLAAGVSTKMLRQNLQNSSESRD